MLHALQSIDPAHMRDFHTTHSVTFQFRRNGTSAYSKRSASTGLAKAALID